MKTKREIQKCGQCGKEFSLPPGQAARRKRGNTTGQVYCSRACAAHTVKKFIGVERISVPCGHCQKPVVGTPGTLRDRAERSQSGKLYCSSKCNGFAHGKKITAAMKALKSKPEIDPNLVAALAAAIAPLIAAQIKKS